MFHPWRAAKTPNNPIIPLSSYLSARRIAKRNQSVLVSCTTSTNKKPPQENVSERVAQNSQSLLVASPFNNPLCQTLTAKSAAERDHQCNTSTFDVLSSSTPTLVSPIEVSNAKAVRIMRCPRTDRCSNMMKPSSWPRPH